MTILELARLLLAVGALVVLPGFLLVQAAFPTRRSRLGWTERSYLTLAAGVSLLAVVGVVLGLLPHGSGRGAFQTAATGVPVVELSLAAASVVLFYVGLRRGAYPAIEARFPRLTTGRPVSRGLETE